MSVPQGRGGHCQREQPLAQARCRTGSSSLSSYRIARSGTLELANTVAGSTGTNAGALDMAVTPAGVQLFALAPRSLQIVAFKVGDDGNLTTLGAASGLPVGSAGLAAN